MFCLLKGDYTVSPSVVKLPPTLKQPKVRRRQHLSHTGATLWALITDHDEIALAQTQSDQLEILWESLKTLGAMGDYWELLGASLFVSCMLFTVNAPQSAHRKYAGISVYKLTIILLVGACTTSGHQAT